jgi:hypothetical protein
MLVLTPEILRAAYDYLNAIPPISKWNLPDSEDIRFQVSRDKKTWGWDTFDPGCNKHCIAVSCRWVGHTHSLLLVMAHEIIHVHQRQLGLSVSHAKSFHKFALQIANVHGFDPRLLG